MRFVVRLQGGSERLVEADSYRRDDVGQKFVFTSDNKEDQFFSVGEVTSIVCQVVEEVKPRDTYDQYKDRLNRLDSHIHFEYQLTAQRLTYLAMSETFLFSTYSAALANHNLEVAHPSIKTMVHVIPWVGTLVALVVFLTVIGAIRATFRLKREREDLDARARGFEEHQALGAGSLEHWAGLLPPLVLPLAFFVAWMFIWPR